MLLDSQAGGHWLKTSLNPLVQDMGTTCCKKNNAGSKICYTTSGDIHF